MKTKTITLRGWNGPATCIDVNDSLSDLVLGVLQDMPHFAADENEDGHFTTTIHAVSNG